MKHKKLALAMLLMLCIVLFALVGCFSSSSDSGTNGGTTDGGQNQNGNGGTTGGKDGEGDSAEFESGKGTQSSPYVIAKPYQWQNISNHLDAYYELKTDLNMGDIENLAPIGTATDPFTGTLDGKGHKIHSAEISTSEACGLFGVISGGTVTNLNFSDSRLSSNYGHSHTGSLVGQIRMGALVENCHVTDVTVNYSYSTVGGLVGTVSSASTLRYCSAKVTLVAVSYSSSSVGGLIGKMEGGTVDACWATGSAKVCNSWGPDSVGGIFGSIVGGKVTNVYTEMTFNTFHGAIAYGSSGGYGVAFGLFFNGANADSKKLYFQTDTAVSDTTSRYYNSTSMEQANNLLDEDEDWAQNPLWKKGRLHPELVSYEEYLELSN